ncbi:hypothetical protein CGRA01v4_12494 [Colletotrichum graminicola]|nr:hypothetical protein CGRA01v4_12494 [Colletotrichum graminicola]
MYAIGGGCRFSKPKKREARYWSDQELNPLRDSDERGGEKPQLRSLGSARLRRSLGSGRES